MSSEFNNELIKNLAPAPTGKKSFFARYWWAGLLGMGCICVVMCLVGALALIAISGGSILLPIFVEAARPIEITTQAPASTRIPASTEAPAVSVTEIVPAATEAPARLVVGVVLPARDEPRWVLDASRFQEVFSSAGYDVLVLFSQGNTATEKANVETLISQGVKVIILCPEDASAAAAAVEEARAAGIKVISYDRLIKNTAAVDYYVAFDYREIGVAQGEYLVSQATGTGNNLYLYAGAVSDPSAFLFFEGVWSKLQPGIADGTFIVRNSSEAVALKNKPTLTRDEEALIIGQITTNWDPNMATNLAQANLVAANAADKGTVFIAAPNDGTARALADAFAADLDVTRYFITGQDAEKASIQYIIDGKQSMTVFKDVRNLVTDATQAALAYLNGGTPEQTTSFNNGSVEVPTRPSALVTVTAANLKAAIIDSGFYPASDFTGLK